MAFSLNSTCGRIGMIFLFTFSVLACTMGLVLLIVLSLTSVKDGITSQRFIHAKCRTHSSKIDNQHKGECKVDTRYESFTSQFSCIKIKVDFTDKTGKSFKGLLMHDSLKNFEKSCSKIVCGDVDEENKKELTKFFKKYSKGSFDCFYDKSDPTKVTVETYPMTTGLIIISICLPLFAAIGGIIGMVYSGRWLKKKRPLRVLQFSSALPVVVDASGPDAESILS